MTWVLTWDYPYDGEHNVTLWSTEESAQMQACSEIQEWISSEWDMCDVDQASTAQSINNFIINRQWQDVISEFNNCDMNTDTDQNQWWAVQEMNTHLPSAATIPSAWAPTFFAALFPDDEEDEEEEDEDETEPYLATTSGATCRGSHAEYNEHAFADRRDGTYLCYQCKMFKQVFG